MNIFRTKLSTYERLIQKSFMNLQYYVLAAKDLMSLYLYFILIPYIVTKIWTIYVIRSQNEPNLSSLLI